MSWPPSRALRFGRAGGTQVGRVGGWSSPRRRREAAFGPAAAALGPARRDAGWSAAAGVAGCAVAAMLQGGEGGGQRGPLLGGERRQPVGQQDRALLPDSLQRRVARWRDRQRAGPCVAGYG